MRRLTWIPCLIVSLNLTGCNLAAQKNSDDGGGNSGQVTGRYQFEKDPQGRLFRLDTVTGEATPVQASASPTSKGIRTSPLRESSASRVQSTTVQETPTARASARVEEPDPTGQINTSVAPRRTQDGSQLRTSASTCPTSGAGMVALDRLDVFFNPQQDAMPIASLRQGTKLTILGEKGEWRLVRFADPQWGQRAGYILCAPAAN